MTFKRKMAICLLTVVCLAMTIMAFQTLSISSETDLSPFVATSASSDILTNDLEILNANFLTPIFTPLKVMSLFVAFFSIILIIATYGVYGKVLRDHSFSTYIPLAVWAISFLVIYLNQPSAPWQVWIGLFVLCLSAYILTVIDERASQSA